MTAAGGARTETQARWLPLLIGLVGLLLSAALAAALAANERAHRAQVAASEVVALERTLRAGLDQRARVLARTARRWQLAGGRTRADFDLEAAVNMESYPSIRAIGWVGSDLVVRWVYPTTGNERVIGLDNRREPRRQAALIAARRTGALRVAGPLALTQGGHALLFFQHIGPDAGPDRGYIYVAFDPAMMVRQIIGDAAPADALRVVIDGAPIYARRAAGAGAMPAGAPSASARFIFGGAVWRVDTWAPPARLGLAGVAPFVAALGSLALAVGVWAALRAQARALSLRGELRAGEERFRTVTDTMPGLLFVTDPAGANVHTNAVFQSYTGLPADALLGDGWLATLHPDDRARAAEVWQRAVADRSTYEAEYRFRRADGAYRWYLVRGQPHYDPDGSIDRWFGTCTDIDDLRAAEERLRLAADVAGFGTFDYDFDADRHLWSPATYRIYGLPPDASPTFAFVNDVIHPDDRARADATLADAITRGDTSLPVEYRIVRPDGAVRHIALRSRIDYLDRDGKRVPMRMVGAVQDVTESRAATEALRESEALLSAVLDALPVGVIIAGADGRILRDNAANRELWGIAPETENWAQYGEWVGYRPETGERVRAEEWAMSRALLSGEVVRNELVQNERFGTGERRFYLNNAAPVRDAEGRIVAGVVAELDVTERLAAEAEVRRLNRHLEALVATRTRRLAEVNAELQAFAYSVSHDLRAPLRAMQGFSAALIEDYGDRLDELGRDYIGRIGAGAKQMDALILDLLAYSRLSREEIVPAPVPLEEAVDAALRQIAAVLHDRAAEVEVLRPLPVVRGHAATLAQVIANLVGNGAKFVASGSTPRIKLWAEARGPNVRLWVEDNGIGIASEHRARIFEVFHRLHGMTEYPGTGIGLAIVKKGIERLGGTVGLESTPDEGSRFWIELPREE